MTNFITNEKGKDLKKRLIELINKSDELKFLVGFFYFSGIRELYQGLKDNPDVKIDVLVGLNVDKQNYGLIEYGDAEKQLSDEERCYKFFESIKKSLNTENFDKKDFYEQVKYFITLIRENKLRIRKTYNPNHAKVYIFKLQEGQVGRRNLFITGSSNLTNSGLSTQEEFNVEISDYGFEDTEKYFDSLWGVAIKITENDVTKKRLLEVIENETLVKEVSPFEAFVLILQVYLDSFEQKEIGESLITTLEENGYTPYQYQLDAVRQALAIIENNNGVIVADVVGLGKTIVACAIAQQLKKRGVVICPPGLTGARDKKSGWEKYLEEFGLSSNGWEVWSLGELDKLQDVVARAKDVEVVIVDEVHRFRNQDTKDYELLKNICREKQVILLTATPFNNRPGDILSLLGLFTPLKKSNLTLDGNLVGQFRGFEGVFERLGYIKKHWNSPDDMKRSKAKSYYKALFEEDKVDLKKVAGRARYLAKQIRDVIEPVTIRRNRLDLKNNPFYKNETKELSEVADPIEWFFELNEEQSAFYSEIIEDYFGDPEEGGRFKGAIYRPFEYERGIKEKKNEEDNRQFLQQRNLFNFMRRLLVKRFESSFGSFEQSIKNFKEITTEILKFIEKTGGGDLLKGKYILDRSLLDKIYEWDIDDIETSLLEYEEIIKRGEKPKSHKVYEIETFKDKAKFIADIQSDLKLFDEILAKLSKLDLVKNDPKTACLLEHLKEEFAKKPNTGEPKRKIIIFSEYVDTVLYLRKELEKQYGDKMLVVAGDLLASKITQINKNFDASYAEQDNDFELLLSSDKISEGFNLNRAGTVINYDIPWNPVRVIQRLGRINRISKKVFDELYIVNFFPTEKGAALVQSREIAANKMFLIHTALGEDSKIFDIDEEPTPAGLFKRVQQNPDKLEGESFYTKALTMYEKIKKENPELIEALKKYPPRVKVAKKHTKDELLVFLKKGHLYVHGVTYSEDGKHRVSPTTFEDVFDSIICGKEEKPLRFSDGAWGAYEQVKNFKEYRANQVSEQSLEQKAISNLKSLLHTVQHNEIMPYKDFLRTILEDVIDYGTLSDYTLRRLSNLKSGDENIETTVREIDVIKKELGGENYLQKVKDHQKDLQKEIIIAIENQKL